MYKRQTKELLIDESLIGWKEYEMEVVRDKNDNCIIVCSIENFDAMGIHKMCIRDSFGSVLILMNYVFHKEYTLVDALKVFSHF